MRDVPMKRGGPPRRRKPLVADPVRQREWERESRRNIKRNGAPKGKDLRKLPNAGNVPVRTPHPKAWGDDPSYNDACREVDRRSGGWCEANIADVCPPGRHRAVHHHHVILRAQGGPDVAWNLLHVCFAGHEWIHGHPTMARERGFIRRAKPVAP